MLTPGDHEASAKHRHRCPVGSCLICDYAQIEVVGYYSVVDDAVRYSLQQGEALN
jgi:hypothetical protein